MNRIIFLLLALLSLTTASEEEIRTKFDQFKRDFSKTYSSQQEEDLRFEIFKEKVLSIEHHNARADVSFRKGNLRCRR